MAKIKNYTVVFVPVDDSQHVVFLPLTTDNIKTIIDHYNNYDLYKNRLIKIEYDDNTIDYKDLYDFIFFHCEEDPTIQMLYDEILNSVKKCNIGIRHYISVVSDAGNKPLRQFEIIDDDTVLDKIADYIVNRQNCSYQVCIDINNDTTIYYDGPSLLYILNDIGKENDTVKRLYDKIMNKKNNIYHMEEL